MGREGERAGVCRGIPVGLGLSAGAGGQIASHKGVLHWVVTSVCVCTRVCQGLCVWVWASASTKCVRVSVCV